MITEQPRPERVECGQAWLIRWAKYVEVVVVCHVDEHGLVTFFDSKDMADVKTMLFDDRTFYIGTLDAALMPEGT